MPPRFIKNFVISLVVVFALTAGYHNGLLGSQYHERLKPVSALDATGNPMADFSAFLLGIVVTALGYAWFVPVAGARNRMYPVHGAIMGLATLGTWTFFAHALVKGWDMWLTGSDFFFGLLTGLIMGGIFMFTEPKT
ncbi:MAG TPA: DUF2177 family protein [Gemmatimonadaceae bacterium]|jgi:hypothetical protein|nr:DUF2177 family protein [Gemmatimonadaceae bacterium]